MVGREIRQVVRCTIVIEPENSAIYQLTFYA